MTIASPCISICRINQHSGYCEGCGRTADEIANWLYFDDAQKEQLINALKQRPKPMAYPSRSTPQP